jgi:hypothetical protein
MRSARALSFLCSSLLLTLPACGPADEPELESAPAADAAPADSPEVATLRQAAARYMDVNVALSEGYIPDPSGMCITAEMEGLPAELGAMGIHYLRPDLLQLSPPTPGARVAGMSTHTDFNQPGVLIYEPQADGSLQLVAVENLVFAAGWRAAGQTAPPSYAGTEYVHMIDDPATPADEAHGFEEHYELHAWVPRENPNGMFTPFNPAATCQHAAHPAPPPAGGN